MKWSVWNVTRDCWHSSTSWGRKEIARDYRDLLIEKEGFAAASLEVRIVPPLLEAHGTKLMELKPSMIWQAAMDDLVRKDQNRGGAIGTIRQYAFHRKHVLKAESANDILRAAIENPAIGRHSAKKITRLLYSDVEQLKAALK